MHWKHSVTNEEPAILAHFCQNYEWAVDHTSEQYYRAIIANDELAMADNAVRYVRLLDDQLEIAVKLLRLKLIQMDIWMPPDTCGELRTLWQRGDNEHPEPA